MKLPIADFFTLVEIKKMLIIYLSEFLKLDNVYISNLNKQELSEILSIYLEIHINTKKGVKIPIDLLHKLTIKKLRLICHYYGLAISNINGYYTKNKLINQLYNLNLTLYQKKQFPNTTIYNNKKSYIYIEKIIDELGIA